MSKQKKRLEKEKKRERARRVEKQRRIDADVSAELMVRSELARDLNDLGGSRRLLEKVLNIRPNHADALERLAATCFRLRRLEEGLAYYERLREPPRWPPVTYNAAVAAWNLERIEQCKMWVTEFLETTRASAAGGFPGPAGPRGIGSTGVPRNFNSRHPGPVRIRTDADGKSLRVAGSRGLLAPGLCVLEASERLR